MIKRISTIALIAFCVISCKCDAIVPVRFPIMLNEKLTNELSDIPELDSLDLEIQKYLNTYHIKGASLSIMKNDSLVYAKGYGWSDIETHMQPNNSLRLASVSKLVTAAGIMKLQEEGKLHLSDKVFGPDGILGNEAANSAIRDKNYYLITIEQLLRHEGGFTTSAGDPMFSTRSLMIQNHLDSVPDFNTLSRIYLRRKIDIPGTEHHYSNYGYLVLSKIIEKVTGESYEDWTQDNILIPSGCRDFHIGHNYYEERFANETRYFPHDNVQVEEYNNSGRKVPRAYGGSDIEGLSGGGAWVASTPELLRFIAAIDGRNGIPDILTQESIAEMTKFLGKEYFGLGWNDITEDGVWTRTGTLAETCALVKYYADGECWVLITNTGTYRGSRQANYTAELFTRLRNKYSSKLPKRDLFFDCFGK